MKKTAPAAMRPSPRQAPQRLADALQACRDLTEQLRAARHQEAAKALAARPKNETIH